jgi:ADP-heptose:LPS heptosyltransferase
VGWGDQLIGTGLARGAKARGKRIAFGDGQRILWDLHSAEMFRGNPNIAKPGVEGDKNLEWIPFYKGHRIYNRQDKAKNRWVWNLEFSPTPGEVFFDLNERRNGRRHGRGFVLIEPTVESWKSVAPNKDWGRDRYQEVVRRLRADGYRVGQFRHLKSQPLLEGVEKFKSTSFRDALSILSHAALYIGAEGGLHHGAAAVGVPGVVLFGGFIPPSVTGYETHANLTGGATACGSLSPCRHCRDAMAAISVDEVYEAAKARL